MNSKFTLFFSLLILFNVNGFAQTIWNGPNITFTKVNFTDWTQEANQDRITDNVWITRADSKGIFNIVTETVYTDDESPDDTEWAFGTTADIGSLTFAAWEITNDSDPPSMIDQDMVLHLITDNIYIDIKFTSWTTGNMGNPGGGGFVYERSTEGSTSIGEVEKYGKIQVYPNPSSDFLYFEDEIKSDNIEIFDVSGKKVLEVEISGKNSINISNLENGIYFIKAQDYTVTKFTKN